VKELFTTRQVARVFKGAVMCLGAVRDADVLCRFTGGGFQFGILSFGFPDESNAFESSFLLIGEVNENWAGQSGRSS